VDGLASDVVARVDALRADVALLAVDGGGGCEGGAGRGRESVERRRDFLDAADRVLQLGERLLSRLELRTDALPVLLLSAESRLSPCSKHNAHLAW
jgi:hypothetical protein